MTDDLGPQLKIWLDEDETSLDDLYRELADTSPQSNAFGTDKAKQGRAMILAMRAQLHGAVCGNDKISAHPAIAGTDNVNDSVTFAALVAAVIPNPVATGLNAALIAAIIVRIGIRIFCNAGGSSRS